MGVVVAAAIAYGMYVGAVRINLQVLPVHRIFLIVVAAGILSYGIGALQTVGWLPGLGAKAFDITAWFDWSSWYGSLIRASSTSSPRPRSQLAGWLTYLTVVLGFFPSANRRPARIASAIQHSCH